MSYEHGGLLGSGVEKRADESGRQAEASLRLGLRFAMNGLLEKKRLQKEKFLEQLPHAPSPLNPYGLRIDGEHYTAIAQRHLVAVLEEGRRTELGRSLEERDSPVFDIMDSSIMGAMHQRLMNNTYKTIPEDCSAESARLFAMACKSQASVSELLELLGLQPGLESLEVGKHTNVFSWAGTEPMDRNVARGIDAHGLRRNELVRGENVHYYFNRVDEVKHPRALVAVRKADIASGRIQNTDVVVVQRDCFAIDLEHEDAAVVRANLIEWLGQQDKETLPGSKKAPYTDEAFVDFMETQLAKLADDRSWAICPGVRSYYARTPKQNEQQTDDFSE